MGTPANILDIIARGGGLVGATDLAQSQAATDLTRAQVPLVQAQAQQAQIAAQQAAQRQKDIQASQQAWAQVYANQNAPNPTGTPAAPSPPSAPAVTNQQAAMPGTGPNPLINRTGAPINGVPSVAAPAATPPTPPVGNPVASPQSYMRFLMKAGVSAPYALEQTQGLVTLQKDITGLDTAQLANREKSYGQAGDALSGYLSDPTPESYQQAYSTIQKIAPDVAHIMDDPAKNPLPSQQSLAAAMGLTKAKQTLLTNAKTAQETDTSKATADKATADAAEARARTEQANLAVEKGRYLFNLQRNATAQQASDGVDGMSIFKGHPQETQDAKDAAAAAFNAALRSDHPENAAAEASKAVQGIADNLRDVNKAKNMIPVETAKAVSVAKATEPIEIDKAVKQQIAIAKNAPGAFSGIPETSARARAENDYDKYSIEYLDKIGTARQLQDTLALAKAGNKSAPTVATLEQLRSIVNRVNRSELDTVQGAGSAFDHLKGWLGGKIEGEPIPDNILDDMTTLSKSTEKAAKRTYDSKLQLIRAKGADVKPVEPPAPDDGGVPADVSQALSGVGPGIHKLSDGSTWVKSPDGTVKKQ